MAKDVITCGDCPTPVALPDTSHSTYPRDLRGLTALTAGDVQGLGPLLSL